MLKFRIPGCCYACSFHAITDKTLKQKKASVRLDRGLLVVVINADYTRIGIRT